MKYFTATYVVESTTYSSFIYAEDQPTAEHYASVRNIGETVTGELIKRSPRFDPTPLPSSFYRSRHIKRCLHTASFYAWIAGMAKIIPDPLLLLRDDGVIHELIHELHHPTKYAFRDPIFKRLVTLENSIPGINSSARA